MALGPGSQFVGPTESILLTVSCARPMNSLQDTRYRSSDKGVG